VLEGPATTYFFIVLITCIHFDILQSAGRPPLQQSI
jgi:hypothetical protein